MMTALGRGRGVAWTLGLILQLLVMAPLDAGAQAVATSFQELQDLVKRGDRVNVTDASGRKIRGRLGELSASDMELLVAKTGSGGRGMFVPQARLSERDVQQVVLERRDSLWNGTLIGLSPGATVGVFVLLVGAGCDCYTVASRAPLALGTILLAGGIGAAIGAGIDASIYERPTIYFRAPLEGSSRLHLSPLLSPSTGGIRVSVQF